jgi:ABC-type antimicrobial peptide transport system permease subunit
MRNACEYQRRQDLKTPRRARMVANTLAGFGVLALLLAAVGICGALAYSVARRRREIGIRVALGSTAASIAALVAQEGLMLAGTGIVAGIAFALPGSWALSHYFRGLSALDLSVVLGSIGVMLGVAVAALAVPALRACRVDPLTALRLQ